MAEENKENEIVCIPGFHGRPPKEVSVKNLAMVIQARVEEIFESVLYEIKSSGLERKLNAGIVITGGGSQLKHLDKLVEFVTGIDARIGYPNEHIAKSIVEEIKSPMYATGVGLVLKGLHTADEVEITHEDEDKKEHKPVQHGSGFLSKWLEKGKAWLNDDDIKDYQN